MANFRNGDIKNTCTYRNDLSYVEIHWRVFFCFQATKKFIEVVNNLRAHRKLGPVSWSTAVLFLLARKFDVGRAVTLYEQHEATRQREGLVNFDPCAEPLRSELLTGKFTILVSTQDFFYF